MKNRVVSDNGVDLQIAHEVQNEDVSDWSDAEMAEFYGRVLEPQEESCRAFPPQGRPESQVVAKKQTRFYVVSLTMTRTQVVTHRVAIEDEASDAAILRGTDILIERVDRSWPAREVTVDPTIIEASYPNAETVLDRVGRYYDLDGELVEKSIVDVINARLAARKAAV